jgi:NADH-ubiquinone oxidoreductase chain 2
MLLTSLFLLLLSNGLTVRKDVSILYSRITIFILMYCILITHETFYITYLEKGLGLYNGLFNATAITHTFQIFIFICSLIILLLTGFFPRKILGEKPVTKTIINLITNKMADQYTIIEYALIILFVVMGGSLLLSSGDFVSLFLCIELQSYGLYILSVIYRDSESATSSGLTYFLLGGLSSCFILLGIVFIYVNTGVSSLDSFYVLSNLTNNYDLLSS